MTLEAKISYKNQFWIEQDRAMLLRGAKPTEAEWQRRREWTPDQPGQDPIDAYEMIVK